MPKVSIIIPNYNHAPYLNWRIDSVLNQTYRDFDVLVLDDCSTDRSRAVMETYRSRLGVSFLYNDKNSGSVFSQWERGASRTSGEYLWIAESDDWADSRFLEKLVPVLDRNPALGLVYSQSWIADTESKITGNAECWTEDLDKRRWKHNYIERGRDEIAQYLTVKNTIPNASAVLMRRTALERALPMDKSFRLCGDWMHWIRILAHSDVAFVAEPLNFWRLNSSNARTAAPGTLEWIEGERVLLEAVRVLGLSEAQRDQILLRFLRKCWQWQVNHIKERGFDARTT